jgi:hypothetical protein
LLLFEGISLAITAGRELIDLPALGPSELLAMEKFFERAGEHSTLQCKAKPLYVGEPSINSLRFYAAGSAPRTARPASVRRSRCGVCGRALPVYSEALRRGWQAWLLVRKGVPARRV